MHIHDSTSVEVIKEVFRKKTGKSTLFRTNNVHLKLKLIYCSGVTYLTILHIIKYHCSTFNTGFQAYTEYIVNNDAE